MKPRKIEGQTRNLGAPVGWKPEIDGECLGLPIRDSVIGGSGKPCMISHWAPTVAEIERINAGAPIEICILGIAHPPISVSVGAVAGDSAGADQIPTTDSDVPA